MVRFTWIIGSLASTPYYSQHLFGLQECVLGRAHHAVFLALSFTLKCSPLSHICLDGTCTRDPNMNLIIQYGLLGLVLGLGLGLGFILHCKIWRPLALPYMCPQPIYVHRVPWGISGHRALPDSRLYRDVMDAFDLNP